METFSGQYGVVWGAIGAEMGLENEVVYVVDDDPIVRDALSSLLRAHGRDVVLFASGAELLSFERRDTVACLILDLKMPGMNGHDVQRVLSAQIPIPIIFITGRGDIPSTDSTRRAF